MNDVPKTIDYFLNSVEKNYNQKPQLTQNPKMKGDKKKQYFEKHIRHQNKEFLTI